MSIECVEFTYGKIEKKPFVNVAFIGHRYTGIDRYIGEDIISRADFYDKNFQKANIFLLDDEDNINAVNGLVGEHGFTEVFIRDDDKCRINPFDLNIRKLDGLYEKKLMLLAFFEALILRRDDVHFNKEQRDTIDRVLNKVYKPYQEKAHKVCIEVGGCGLYPSMSPTMKDFFYALKEDGTEVAEKLALGFEPFAVGDRRRLFGGCTTLDLNGDKAQGFANKRFYFNLIHWYGTYCKAMYIACMDYISNYAFLEAGKYKSTFLYVEHMEMFLNEVTDNWLTMFLNDRKNEYFATLGHFWDIPKVECAEGVLMKFGNIKSFGVNEAEAHHYERSLSHPKGNCEYIINYGQERKEERKRE